ncbi:MAG: phenylalanine--tRNA ligase subunit beta [Clostridia bacterium]
MNVSVSWLDKYVGANMQPQEIADLLTMTGTKVETLEKFGKKVEKVVVGKVEEISMHPTKDKLKVLKINIENATVTAVANIPDIAVGDVTAVALEGAKTANKEVESSNIDGVTSNAMIVHVEELGLKAAELPNVKESGLVIFPSYIKLGEDVSTLLKLGEEVIEFEITPNRPDCLAVEGIAREFAASTSREFKDIYKDSKITKDTKVENINGLEVKVETENCFRYSLRVIEDVKIEESPLWLQMKLIKSGIRPINNIVDITNYVMVTYGQPLHAFDSSKLSGNKIVVRQAKENEKLELLDETVKNLVAEDLIIADTTSPVAIAGVMGGKLSGINSSTKVVALESATFKRGSVRLSAKRHAVRTDASSRFEKGLPEELTMLALNEACTLIKLLGAGKVIDGYIDVYPNKQAVNKVKTSYKYLTSFIGTEISKEKINEIFRLLDMKVEENDGENFVVIPPMYRQDVAIKEDLAEEVARIYGYEKLNSQSYSGEVTVGVKTRKQKLEDKVKNIMVAGGYSEIYTYTFLNSEDLDKLNIPKEDKIRDCIEVINPLSSDFTFMRTTTVSSMIEALDRNYNKKNANVKLFELGKIFTNKKNITERGELPKEELILSIGAYDAEIKPKDSGKKFFEFKGVVEKVLRGLNIDKYTVERYTESSIYHPGQSAKILVNGEEICYLGKINPRVTKNFNMPEETYIAEINFEKLYSLSKDYVKFIDIPKFPAVERDLAFTVKEDILSGDIVSSIKSISTLIEDVKLFDVYQGSNIEKGYKSMAYSIVLRDKEKTLKAEEIEKIMADILKVLEEKYGAEIRK